MPTHGMIVTPPLTVTVTTKVSYTRWRAPNYANQARPPRPRQEGIGSGLYTPGTHVSELPVEALDALAQAWLEDLYTNAKKPNRWAIISISE